jgi:hypothetical protein
MKKHLLILFLFTLTSIAGFAQDVKKPQPDSLIKVIPFGYGRHVENVYTIDGKLQSPEDISSRLLSYAPAATEYNKAKNEGTWAYVFLGGATIASFGAIAEYANNNKPVVATAAFVNGQPGFTYAYPNNNKTGAYILTGAALGFVTAAITTWVNAAIHSKKAIDYYNQRFE